MNDYELERDRSYPDALAEPRYGSTQSGYGTDGYPEGVVMRKKPSDRPYYPYQPQYHDTEGYPERDGTRLPDEYVPGGNALARTTATSLAPPGALVSSNPHDLYARVVKPSERDQNMITRWPHKVDTSQPNFERGPEGSIDSNASFALRPDGGRTDDRWRPTAAAADVGPIQQRDLQPSRDHNYNVSKPSSTDGPSRSNSQQRVYRPGERHIDGTPMFGDPSKDPRQQMTSPSSRPTQLPLPSSMRGQYIDDLAATKTPHTQQDLMQAKALSQQRHAQPSYFQYPEGDNARQVCSGLDHRV